MKNKIEVGDLVRFQDHEDVSLTGAGLVVGVEFDRVQWHFDGKERVAEIFGHNGKTYFRALVRCQLLAKGKQ